MEGVASLPLYLTILLYMKQAYNKDKFNYRFISNNLDLIKIKIKEFEKIIPTLMVILKKNAVNSKEVKETFNIFKLKLNMDNKLIDKPLIKKLKI